VENEQKVSRKQLHKILTKFKQLNPWSGTIAERKQKFLWLHEKICEATGESVKLEFDLPSRLSLWRHSSYNRSKQEIILRRLSVIALLHEWGHALGMGEDSARAFAVSLCKEVFPENMNV